MLLYSTHGLQSEGQLRNRQTLEEKKFRKKESS
jgi:hypothetical protein